LEGVPRPLRDLPEEPLRDEPLLNEETLAAVVRLQLLPLSLEDILREAKGRFAEEPEPPFLKLLFHLHDLQVQ
jgi:hypothetical protein